LDAEAVVEDQCYAEPNADSSNVSAAFAASDVVSIGTRELEQPAEIARWTAYNSRHAIAVHANDSERKPLVESEGKVQCSLVRCVFANPFRQVIDATSCRAWNSTLVGTVAEAIYSARAFHRLPILADALEDAGCTNAELLGHLRGPGPHARGCWALDLVLAKE
jgi:hypothetical protein